MGIYEKALEIQTLVNELKANLKLETTTPLEEVVTATVGGGSSGGSYAPRFITFYYYTGTELDQETKNLDTSNMTSTKQMFYGCSNLTSLDLSGWNTSNVTDMSSMFAQSSNLTTIDFSGWDTSNVTNMNSMFYYCSNKLTELDLSSFNTSKVTNMSNMFSYCKALTKLDIRNFDFTKVSTYSYMFGSKATSGVPDDCLIIVKDDTAKTWVTTWFSRLTNVKTVAEL